MPGLNTTGTPNTADYNLGRGRVFFAALLSDGKPGAYRELGNSPEFNINVESETLEHMSSMNGLRVVDNEVVISQKVGLSLTLDEINFQNLAMFMSGEAAAMAAANPAIAGFTVEDWITTALHGGVELGRWYDLIKPSTGVRLYDVATVNIVLVEKAGVVTLVEDTDYTIDLKMGRIFFLTTATNVAALDEVTLTVTADATAKQPDEVKALTLSDLTGALKFVSENPGDEDHQTEYQFHKVQLKAEGDFALIADEFTQMQMTGTAETNADADVDSPTLTIRTHAAA